MEKETNNIDYGIYVDHKHAYIIALNHNSHESLIQLDEDDNTETNYSIAGGDDFHQQKHVQNAKNEHLKKYCKSIVEKIENAHHILIFGPSVTKFELQKEVRDTKHLNHITEELLVTDKMNKSEATNYAKEHYKKKVVDQSPT